MRSFFSLTTVFLLGAALSVLLSGCSRDVNHRSKLESELRQDGKILLQVSSAVPGDCTGRSIFYDHNVLETHQLYVRNTQDADGFIYVKACGEVVVNGVNAAVLDNAGELLFGKDQSLFFVDDVLLADITGWDIFWVHTEVATPTVSHVLYPEVAFVDSFMRQELANSHCHITAGTWQLNQRGGGMPLNEEQLHDYSVQRAVNPFSVRGSGILTYPQSPALNLSAQAHFYFGVPRDGHVIDTHTMPDSDMLIAQGQLDVLQVAFGYSATAKAFVLMQRDEGQVRWEVLQSWDQARPALTNWFKLELRVHNGHRVEALLDEHLLFTHAFKQRIYADVQLIAGTHEVECDDVRIATMDRQQERWEPFYVRSRYFAGKAEKEGSDPDQFSEWAKSAGLFLRQREVAEDGLRGALIVTRFPLLGDFIYESAAVTSNASGMAKGDYEIRFYRPPGDELFRPWEGEICFSLKMSLDDNGWSFPELSSSNEVFAVQLARRAQNNHSISISLADSEQIISEPLPGPLHLAVVRYAAHERQQPGYPEAEQHQIKCRNLVNELFEAAPSDWSWVEGAFRMDARWACQDQWNFMACGSTGVPFMTSKRRFEGDQMFEYYMSLRPVYPWDAGDADFSYDPSTDTNWQIFIANDGWYVRRDLNFSFCHDGRNPLSGYAVVFGGDDNRETRLLRKGEIVARTRKPDFLFPTETQHGVIHWKWWKFSVRKLGDRILVALNDKLIFDYADPEPLPGGHFAFWSIRNGFTVSRMSGIAEDIEFVPQVLYVKDDDIQDWQPLHRDSVQLIHDGNGGTEVHRQVDSGFHAVRKVFDEAIDLQETPILTLPLDVAPYAICHLHLYINERSFILPIHGSIVEMKSLLTPEYEKGECFRIPTLSDWQLRTRYSLGQAQIRDGKLVVNLLEALKTVAADLQSPRLQVMTLGNSSNEDYQLAGASYIEQPTRLFTVGKPHFSSGRGMARRPD